jgi:hypothetical protein
VVGTEGQGSKENFLRWPYANKYLNIVVMQSIWGERH